MTAVIVTTPAGPNRTAVTLDERVIGYIIDSGYGYHIADVRQAEGRAAPIVVDSYKEALALFSSLTHLPVGEECFCGFLQAEQVVGSTWVNEGEPAVASMHINSPPTATSAEFSFDFHLDADELRSLIYNLQFMLARLAVTS
jgi:hypothetical protein